MGTGRMYHMDGLIPVFHINGLYPRGADFVVADVHPINQSCNEGIRLQPSRTGQYKLPQELLWGCKV